MGSLDQLQINNTPNLACVSHSPAHLFFPHGRRRLGDVLWPQLSELLAGSSLTLITFSSSTLQLADVAANFCHILNLYIAFLARVQFKSVSWVDVSIQRRAPPPLCPFSWVALTDTTGTHCPTVLELGGLRSQCLHGCFCLFLPLPHSSGFLASVASLAVAVSPISAFAFMQPRTQPCWPPVSDVQLQNTEKAGQAYTLQRVPCAVF